ncbi:hypothetical protein [Pseudomonas benzenivorans]|uniref:Uncharacterized protein n=1 Tax=Pseudomonas benzenivorans TaxID=556533 RepID=A0ABY5HBJ6_9PSED|nr:hypothetical protein [Pseudomonas benzenivorans]UTW09721.1 hypothetical protein KDW96_10625 [Pseudomonas benzenivorans]
MENSLFFRVVKPLVSVACLILLIESLRTGSTLGFGKTGFYWVSQAVHPVRFWVANISLVALAVLGLLGAVQRKRG